MNVSPKWRQATVVAAVAIFSASLALYGCQQTQETAVAASQTPVERGKYLVTIMGCNDCHTPMKVTPEGLQPDMSRMLSGHPEDLVMPTPPALGDGPWVWSGAGSLTAFAGPWGVSYAANLTPDTNTGLGIWTEDMFIRAIREGKHMGTSRTIQPPMPWLWYRHCTDEDLKAIFAYLKSLPPVENHVPEYRPPASTDEG